MIYNFTGDTSSGLIYEDMEHSGEEEPIPSMASSGPWGHSIYSSLSYISNTILHRGQRSTLTRHSLGPTLPQVQYSLNLVLNCNVIYYSVVYPKQPCCSRMLIVCGRPWGSSPVPFSWDSNTQMYLACPIFTKMVMILY